MHVSVIFLSGVLILFCCFKGNISITERQLKAAVKLVRNVCQPKLKVSDEQIDMMHRGEWDIERSTKCYMACSLGMYKLMNKENQFDYNQGIYAMEHNVPEPRRPATKKVMQACIDSVKTPNDRCEAGYEISKCFYFANSTVGISPFE